MFINTTQLPSQDPDLIDITIKSGIKAFAPTWPMVIGHKNGTITEKEYTDQYYSLMRISSRKNRTEWDQLLVRE